MTDQTRRNLLLGGSALVAVIAASLLLGKRVASHRDDSAISGQPKRPKGRSKPMIEEDIEPTLARLDRWYASHLSKEYIFNPPASDAALDAFEKQIGIKMPKSYRQLYHWHDGEEDDRWGHIYGLPLLSLKQAGFQWQTWNEVLADFKGNRYEISGRAWPEGAVDSAYINTRWIPLTHDGSGNHIGLDFDPWPSGRIGQVILYGRDEDVKAVIAESLGAFLSWIADLLESGNFSFGDEQQQSLREFQLKSPPDTHFHDGARKLLGAPGPYN